MENVILCPKFIQIKAFKYRFLADFFPFRAEIYLQGKNHEGSDHDGSIDMHSSVSPWGSWITFKVYIICTSAKVDAQLEIVIQGSNSFWLSIYSKLLQLGPWRETVLYESVFVLIEEKKISHHLLIISMTDQVIMFGVYEHYAFKVGIHPPNVLAIAPLYDLQNTVITRVQTASIYGLLNPKLVHEDSCRPLSELPHTSTKTDGVMFHMRWRRTMMPENGGTDDVDGVKRVDYSGYVYSVIIKSIFESKSRFLNAIDSDSHRARLKGFGKDITHWLPTDAFPWWNGKVLLEAPRPRLGVCPVLDRCGQEGTGGKFMVQPIHNDVF
ncbi:hypothetical protein E5288_WYG008088 [Bos mutus]|uniref:Uncharacterized protein n=1 Tax=Bos mutus TaxID=72004 RepID=A0A6B0RV18_9CETA|nr:hypothetical protein [Bos mutus]